MSNLFERIDNGLSFERVCMHFWESPDYIAQVIDCRCPYGAEGYLSEEVKLRSMDPEEAEAYLASVD